MSGFVELVSCSQTRWTRPDDGHLFSRPNLRRVGFDPTILESSVHDGTLDVLDGDRRLVDAENASSLARCRAHTACLNVKHQKCFNRDHFIAFFELSYFSFEPWHGFYLEGGSNAVNCPTCELWEVVCLQKLIECFLPVVVED